MLLTKKKKEIKVKCRIYTNQEIKRAFAVFIRYFLTLVLKSVKTTEFLAAEGNELKTLEALSWKVPDSRGTFNVVSFEDDFSVLVGL